MAKIGMTPGGQFGNMFAQTLEAKRMSLGSVAQRVGRSYEQMRKVFLGTSTPSPPLVTKLSKILGMDVKQAQEAATQDRMQRRFGAKGLKALGRDPRLAALDAVATLLSDQDLQTVITVAHGLVKSRGKG
jgi:transcriptional regulator with XRE-family HTH domain